MDPKAYNAQVERALLREAAVGCASSLQETLRLMQVEQQTLFLQLGYDEQGRRAMTGFLAKNLLHSGFGPYAPQALHEMVGSVYLEKLVWSLLYESHDEIAAHIEAVAILEALPEFRAYVRTHHPPSPITPGSLRRDRPSSTSRGKDDISLSELATDVSEVPPSQRAYYHRGVFRLVSRRTSGRTRWRDDRAVPEL